jgi:hypothetical protein
MTTLSPRRSLRNLVIAACASLTLPLVAFGADKGPAIEDLAPAKAVFYGAIPDYAAFSTQWDESVYKQALNNPAIKAWWEKFLKQSLPEETGPRAWLTSLLKDTDTKLEDLPQPVGSVGVAAYLAAPAAKPAPDAPAPSPLQWLASANFTKDGADKLNTFLDKALERMVAKKEIELKEEAHAGINIRAITITPPAPEANGGAEEPGLAPDDEMAGLEEDEGEAQDMGAPPRGRGRGPAAKPEPVRLFAARVGDTMLLTGELGAMKQAIDMAEGKGSAALSSTALYKDTLAVQPKGAVVVFAAMIEPLVEIANNPEALRTLRGSVPDAPIPMDPTDALASIASPQAQGIIKALGVKGTRAAAGSLVFNTDKASSEVNVHLLMPKPSGLMALMTPLETTDAPAFAGADVYEIVGAHVEFAKLLTWARNDLLPNLPPDQKEQLEVFVMQAEEMAGPVLTNAGPTIFALKSPVEIPAGEDAFGASQNTIVYALRMKDVTPLKNLIDQFGGGMLKPEDFQGNQLYAGEGLPVVLGMGFEHIFIGPKVLVQNAMRAAAQADGAKLTGDTRWKAARGLIEPGAFYFAWSNTRTSYTEAGKIAAALRKALVGEGLPEAEADTTVRNMTAGWAVDLPPIDELAKYLGDTLAEMHWVETGLRLRVRALRP